MAIPLVTATLNRRWSPGHDKGNNNHVNSNDNDSDTDNDDDYNDDKNDDDNNSNSNDNNHDDDKYNKENDDMFTNKPQRPLYFKRAHS